MSTATTIHAEPIEIVSITMPREDAVQLRHTLPFDHSKATGNVYDALSKAGLSEWPDEIRPINPPTVSITETPRTVTGYHLELSVPEAKILMDILVEDTTWSDDDATKGGVAYNIYHSLQNVRAEE